MNDAAFVGVLNGASQRLNESGGLGRRPRHAGELILQTFAGHVFQGQVGMAGALPYLVNLHDVRVLQLGGSLGLDVEALPLLRPCMRPGQNHLERDVPVELHVPSEIDDAHAATAQLALDDVAGHVRGPQRRRFALRQRGLPVVRQSEIGGPPQSGQAGSLPFQRWPCTQT